MQIIRLILTSLALFLNITAFGNSYVGTWEGNYQILTEKGLNYSPSHVTTGKALAIIEPTNSKKFYKITWYWKHSDKKNPSHLPKKGYIHSGHHIEIAARTKNDKNLLGVAPDETKFSNWSFQGKNATVIIREIRGFHPEKNVSFVAILELRKISNDTVPSKSKLKKLQ